MKLPFFRHLQPVKHGRLLDAPLSGANRCRECNGDCCRSFSAIDLTWQEYLTLRNLGALQLHQSFSGRCQLLIDLGCEFLNNGRCTIYDQRPEVCRRFYCED